MNRLFLIASVFTLTACNTAQKPFEPTASQEAAPVHTFALLMYEHGDSWHHLSPEAQSELMTKYNAWVKDLQGRGIFKDGSPIGRGGVRIALDAHNVPDAEPLDVNATSLTGFFIIEVKDAAEAERIAATCPALLHGETVHVRPVGHE
jgi:hypothetical protein